MMTNKGYALLTLKEASDILHAIIDHNCKAFPIKELDQLLDVEHAMGMAQRQIDSLTVDIQKLSETLQDFIDVRD